MKNKQFDKDIELAKLQAKMVNIQGRHNTGIGGGFAGLVTLGVLIWSGTVPLFLMPPILVLMALIVYAMFFSLKRYRKENRQIREDFRKIYNKEPIEF